MTVIQIVTGRTGTGDIVFTLYTPSVGGGGVECFQKAHTTFAICKETYIYIF